MSRDFSCRAIQKGQRKDKNWYLAEWNSHSFPAYDSSTVSSISNKEFVMHKESGGGSAPRVPISATAFFELPFDIQLMTET
jgi:hypothetical protein